MIEAVAGVEFGAAWDFAPASAAVVSSLRHDYSTSAFLPAIPPTPVGEGDSVFQTFFTAGVGPAPVRLQLTSPDNVWVAQLQADRLTVNWRRLDERSAYPGYGEMQRRLEQLLLAVTAAVPGGTLRPTTLEYTYVNGINRPAPEVFRLLDPAVFRDPDLEGVEVRFQVNIPNSSGRVAVSVEPRVEAGQRGSVLTVVSNHFVTEAVSMHHLLELVDRAHVQARHAFAWITTDAARAAWGESHNDDD
ncbi:TIGR04255 family protein [Microbacterium sp.]|uniref:TIGR04255 family protein n=1 Tax=Microbacterium sp. TaxID=51671 RepID=UPI003F6F7A25